MKKILLILVLSILSGKNIFSQKKSNQMNVIVLVHGAWLDNTSWDKLVPILKAAGHEVIIVKLPGHGSDNTPYGQITLQSYVDAVKKAIGSRKDVTLAGHSMAGIVISETAEQIPDQIRNLVYINAYLPRNGETLLQLGNSDKGSHIPKYLRPDEKSGSAAIATEGVQEIFAADASQADVDKLIAGNKPDALAPLATPVVLTDANFGKIPKTYIYTQFDQAISLSLQQMMVENNGTVKRTYEIPTSHTAFIAMPGVLAAILIQEAK
jgi:pimeloyl-ACP methyl ester carboxylesterase